MIDVGTERMLTVTQAAKELPSRPHIAVVWRWVNRGCRGVKLESVKIAGVRYTSREALHRFVRRVTAPRRGEDSSGEDSGSIARRTKTNPA